MRRIVIWLASTVTVVVLLLGYHTSTSSTATAAGSSSTAPAAPSTTSSASGPPTPSSGTSGSSGSSSGTKTWTGDVASTRWGPVQVSITVTDGKVTRVDVLRSPDGNPRDTEINARALPVLVRETIEAQSAKIDMVSGATVTSDGYLTSLQSALDQAGI